MIKIPDSDALIESLILEAEDEVSPKLDNSRLATPLNTAYRNVASSIAIIPTLNPQQRKEASIKLVDITEAALQAVEKTLKRNGSNDSSLLQQVKMLLKRIEAFDTALSALQVSESVDFSSADDPEAQWGHDENGMVEPFTKDEEVDTIEPIAMRILKNNADVPAEAAEGDPAKEDDVAPPEGSEGTDQTIDDTAENEMIAKLASETDKEQEKEAVPAQFKALQTNESLIHENTSRNLEILSFLGNI